MFERYGPWSSALGDGHTSRLSTFWRRRLAMLSAVREAPTALSRRDWLKLGAAGIAAGSVPTLLLARPSGPADAEPEEPGTIYIQALQAGPDDGESIAGIFAIDPEAETWRRISNLYGSVCVSRDGRTLAISRSGFTGSPRREIENTGVWTLDSEGKGEPRRISDFGGVTSWSPDGSRLIVSRWSWDAEQDEAIRGNWRFNVDGTWATKLPIPETDSVHDWSPDGEWVVTVSDRHQPHGRGYQLYLMRPDGTDERRLTEGGLNHGPRFSPDSQQIAYLRSEKGESALWVVNADGGDRRLVVREENNTGPNQFCGWSPDGKSLAFDIETWSRDDEGRRFLGPEDSNPRLAIIDLDGTNLRPLDLPRARWIGSPDWR